MKLGELGEFGLISRIAALSTPGPGVVTGIGDDAAVTALTPGMQLLTSTDMLLEDVHFRRCWHDPYRLGRKSLAVNISDLAAMGAIPRWALLSLAIPSDLPLDFLDEFVRGFLAMAAEHAVSLIGGDTCGSRSGLAISVTIMGEQLPERILRRRGACPDDDIWITGTVGDAAFGLKLLEREDGAEQSPVRSPLLPLPHKTVEEQAYLVSRLLDPTPRVAAGIALAESGLATAMIDVSDGLLADFGHIAEASSLGGLINRELLPVSSAFKAVAATREHLPYQLLLSGGEDYELVFTAARADREKIIGLMKNCGVDATPVGIVTRSPDIVVTDASGAICVQQNKGFNHFD